MTAKPDMQPTSHGCGSRAQVSQGEQSAREPRDTAPGPPEQSGSRWEPLWSLRRTRRSPALRPRDLASPPGLTVVQGA